MLSGCLASKYIGWPKVYILAPVISLPEAVDKTQMSVTEQSRWLLHLFPHLNNWTTNLSVKMFVDASELLEYAAMNCVLQVHAALYVCL